MKRSRFPWITAVVVFLCSASPFLTYTWYTLIVNSPLRDVLQTNTLGSWLVAALIFAVGIFGLVGVLLLLPAIYVLWASVLAWAIGLQSDRPQLTREAKGAINRV